MIGWTLVVLWVSLASLAGAAPSSSAGEAVGSYANGCLIGGVSVGEVGEGYRLIRRHRRRFYAHRSLADFIEGYGEAVKAAGLPEVLVGDLSQVHGGRMSSGHRSHQIGLDVDLWFSRPKRRGADKHFASLVRGELIDARVFGPEHLKLLKIAATQPNVARIFVGWVIKRELCRVVEGDRTWLRKIRPWYGHTQHFHVRLSCPPDSPECKDQKAPPEGDSCGTEDWFSKANVASRKAKAKTAGSKPRRPKAPRPARCQALKR